MDDKLQLANECQQIPEELGSLDELESQLSDVLESQLSDLNELELDREKIGDPDSIGEVVKNVVWEQFINQVGVIAGEDFIRENRGLTLDLRKSAHIQTTENFEKGKIATHNHAIDYQKRYDDWQSNFQHDENGNVITHTTRTGKEEATLAPGARAPFDKGRPTGSAERGTDMDHTVSAGEIIRNPAANAHLSKEEQIAFANSEANLNEMPSDQNRSKGDLDMKDWLDKPNSNGQKPNEIFDINEETDKQYREKDAEAREELDKRIKEGEQRSIETGKKSQREEAMRIGGAALKSVVMLLLASLIKTIIGKLIVWFREGKRKLSSFTESVKDAIHSFVSNLKEHLHDAGNAFLTSIATAIWGPVVGAIKKVWIFLKQGYKSVKDAINFLKNPANKNLPFWLKLSEVGKIVIATAAAGGTIFLSEAFEKGLISMGLTLVIPVIGTMASLIGMFFGALISGLIGALALRMIDKAVSKRLKQDATDKIIVKQNEILQTQDTLLTVKAQQRSEQEEKTASNIISRHNEAKEHIRDSVTRIIENQKEISDNEILIKKNHVESLDLSETKKQLDDIMKSLNNR